jgi:hypothetical protein
VSTFVIRNQGFFYTDEYFAPVGEYKQILRRSFETHAAAEEARRVYVRSWIRQHPLGDFLFDDGAAIAKVVAFFRERWPEAYEDLESDELYDLMIPDHATDDDVDAVLAAGELELAKVFELGEGEVSVGAELHEDAGRGDELGDGEDDDELGGDDEVDDYDEDFDAIYWGPTEGQRAYRVISSD